MLISLVAVVGLSACASQRMESPGSAWELVQERQMVGAKSKSKAPASDKIVHTRKAVSLAPELNEQAHSAPEGPALASRGMDDRSPTGWSRTELVANWGAPSLIEGNAWKYRSRDGGRCVSLSLKGGIVTSSTPSCR